MAKVWKVFALLLVVTALVWLTTLWRWQSAWVDPSPQQMLLHLALLPLAITASFVALVWGVRRLRGYAASAPPPPVAGTTGAASAAAGSAGAGASPEASARPLPSRVIAAMAHLRAGATWEEAHARISDGDCKIGLDPTLKDDDGIAVFTAAHDDLSADHIADVLEGLIEQHAQQQPEAPPLSLPEPEVQRALALLEVAVHGTRDAVEQEWAALAAPPPGAGPSGAGGPPAATPLPPTVSIRVGIPSRWPDATRQLVTAWLHQLLDPIVGDGLQAAGQSRALASAAGTRPAVDWHLQPHDSAEAFWLHTQQQLAHWQRERQPGLLWALVADSLVGDDTVNRMTHDGVLFSGRHQQGRVPGEAGAALVLASPHWPSPPTAEPAWAQLHATSVARRDKSADASGRITPDALQQALRDTLQGAGLDAAVITHLTTDADHRSSRTAEVYQTVQDMLSHLDAPQHALRLGVGCGDLGIAGIAACAALTAHQVQTSATPALLLGLQSPFDRLAVLLSPVTPPQPA